MSVLVTVGTTKFDLLIRQVDTREFHDKLLDCGYTHLIIQYGSGEYVPVEREVQHSSVSEDNVGHRESLRIVSTAYLREIQYSEYDLVIGHAGAGTILNSLRSNVSFQSPKTGTEDCTLTRNLTLLHQTNQRKMIVVINKSLMDNHQAELAAQLHKDKHLFAIDEIRDLNQMIQVITSATFSHNPQNQNQSSNYLIPFPKASNSRFKEEINKLLSNKDIWKH
ncbi:glycosyl transferase [Cryptosporidium canis]|uniref:UDP-N-acetylglucosamine transferase subunit ALG13 n=1 Tax=Cryptosporidium canis TaxID=195482 RepID=A0ABQ8P5K2_9CRYT|nr:glycosyl transferase [Cryptosporidium canis]